jgi:molecular chaperone DnaK (HSP70)
MKQLLLAATLFTAAFSFAQEVKTSEESVSFSNGSHNAIVVTIPYANKEVVEKELKSEMKDWGGKHNSSKGEHTAIQASMKSMGSKPFDGYAKIIESGDVIKVAFAVDLGGAYMDSRQHSAQYKVIQERAKKFATKTATTGVENELAAEAKILKEMEKDKSDLEKSIENSKKDIEDYKKRIEEAEQKIKDNESALSKKGEEITTQTTKIGDVEKKKKSIR